MKFTANIYFDVEFEAEDEEAASDFVSDLKLPDGYVKNSSGAEINALTVNCQFCHKEVPTKTAHLLKGEWVGDECCRDERLR